MFALLRSVIPKWATAACASCPSAVSVFVGPALLFEEVLGKVFGSVSSTQIPASCSAGFVMCCCEPEASVWKYWVWTPAQPVPPICWTKSAVYLPAPSGSHGSVALNVPSVIASAEQVVPFGQAPFWPQPQ